MLSLSQFLLGTTVALTAVSAANLPERREDTSRSMSTDVTTPQGIFTFANLEYCRQTDWNANSLSGEQGWAQPGLVNVSIHQYPCEAYETPAACPLIEQVAVNINLTDSFSWVVDVPVNVTYIMFYSQAHAAGNTSTAFESFTSVPPYDSQACDQSLLNQTFSAASLSNATGRIGVAHEANLRPTSGAETVVGARTYPVAALALVAAGAAAFF